MRLHAIALCSLSWVATTTAVCAEGGSGQVGPPKSTPSPKRWVSIECPPMMLPETERTPQGELKAILGLRGILKVERPIRYRNLSLPAGSYPVAIAASEGGKDPRGLAFIIGSPPDKDREGVSSETSKPEETKIEEKNTKEKNTEEKNTEEKNGGKKRGEGKSATGAGGGSGLGTGAGSPATPAGGQIRAVFRLTQAKNPVSKIGIEVRQSAKGDRFSLMVRGGSSQGKATIRLDGSEGQDRG